MGARVESCERTRTTRSYCAPPPAAAAGRPRSSAQSDSRLGLVNASSVADRLAGELELGRASARLAGRISRQPRLSETRRPVVRHMEANGTGEALEEASLLLASEQESNGSLRRCRRLDRRSTASTAPSRARTVSRPCSGGTRRRRVLPSRGWGHRCRKLVSCRSTVEAVGRDGCRRGASSGEERVGSASAEERIRSGSACQLIAAGVSGQAIVPRPPPRTSTSAPMRSRSPRSPSSRSPVRSARTECRRAP